MMPWTVSGERGAVRALVEQAHELLRVQRIAAGPLEERRLDIGRDRGLLEKRVHELRGLIARERRKRERQRIRLATSPGRAAREQFRSGSADDEQGDTGSPVGQMVDEVEEAFVGPVEVLEDEDERALVGDPLEKATPRRKRLILTLNSAPRRPRPPPAGGDG